MREPDRIVRLKTVLARSGLSRSTIYRKIAEGTFPAQLKISTNGTGWHESDINRWIADPVSWRPKRESTGPASGRKGCRCRAPRLCGFGLDGLTSPRFELSKQIRADWERYAQFGTESGGARRKIFPN
jgi:prophage regulatory protein